ncbi:Ribose operon repressor [Lentibacillus sp. JNUCC-1]|uniref:substrate-binding domain-containing protein n=1 Tax=Lentibacillus sp. JNUCC-1 TaxID=2654513 RepID=UPI0012E792CA|nr:substrate-binding domain-containing protein [Lentibacillus sp. JNUCC-1]MUV36763.1 Ribose operon repressor [Lentibacillus sp. JNUCC-1]
MAFLKTALKLNKSIPNDLQLVGFDGIELGRMVYPELTTIAQPVYQIGQKASRLLLQLINKEKVKQIHIQLPTELVYGSTTRKEDFHE